MHTPTRTLAVIVSLAALSACGPADPCAGGGTATVRVRLVSTISGAKGLLTGPDGTVREAVSTDTMTTVELGSVPSGMWSATGERYAEPDTRVRTAYAADSSSFCVGNGGTHEVTITWSPMPTSGAMWTLNGSGGSGNLLSFPAAALRVTGTVAAVSKGNGPFGRDVTFDPDGNVWSLGATTAESHVVMTEASHLSGAGTKSADRSINIAGITCGPSVAGVAFDKAGNLWVSSLCMNEVYKLTPTQLSASGEVTPSVKLGGFDGPRGLAFDKNGNLYVADSGADRISRFDAAALTASTSTASARIQALRTDNPMDSSVLAPSWLAFDKDGNLWADDFGANVIYFVSAANLVAGGDRTVTPGVRITLSVGALLEGIAFDEAGGLWVAGSTGKVVRLDASQLSTSSNGGNPTAPQVVLSSADIAYASNMAFFPAAANLPLAHAMK
ncbi:MAG: hypothetical protein JNK82_01195 [Myxococcaceae bacterium]|nr:hypothetical protein [Myxococcaceae bacterium]